jgi:AcrR family transcriptional regulator
LPAGERGQVSKRHDEGILTQLPSGRHGLSRDYVARSQRARLVSAALGIAGTAGYPAMTVTAVIERARVSRKTFYDFFEDREACFLAVHEAVLERGVDGVRHAYGAGGDWPEALRGALAWLLRALALAPPAARVAFVEALGAGPRALARRDAARRELVALLEPGFAAAPHTLALPPLLPEMVLGGVETLIAGRVREGRTDELPHLLPHVLYCVLAPFLGAEPAAAHAGLPSPAARRGAVHA